MAADGAAIIDVGAESTRPGSEAVSVDVQILRAIPVIKELSKKRWQASLHKPTGRMSGTLRSLSI
jgi:dihydropteroate synthase